MRSKQETDNKPQAKQKFKPVSQTLLLRKATIAMLQGEPQDTNSPELLKKSITSKSSQDPMKMLEEEAPSSDGDDDEAHNESDAANREPSRKTK